MQKISMSKSTDLTMREGFDNFIKKCAIKNLSPATLRVYNLHYRMFKRFTGQFMFCITVLQMADVHDAQVEFDKYELLIIHRQYIIL